MYKAGPLEQDLIFWLKANQACSPYLLLRNKCVDKRKQNPFNNPKAELLETVMRNLLAQESNYVVFLRTLQYLSKILVKQIHFHNFRADNKN